MADDFEDHPELAGYDPGDERPLRHPMFVRVMRVAIVAGIGSLIIPGVLVTIGVQQATAERACAAIVAARAPSQTPVPRFEALGPAGPGWYCYARALDGDELLLDSLGLIPG